MGVVIQGPWPAQAQRPPVRNVRPLIEHELILVKKFEERRKALERLASAPSTLGVERY